MPIYILLGKVGTLLKLQLSCCAKCRATGVDEGSGVDGTRLGHAVAD